MYLQYTHTHVHMYISIHTLLMQVSSAVSSTDNTLMDPVEECGGRDGRGKPSEFVVGGKSSLQKEDKKDKIKVEVTVEVEISKTKSK